MIKIKVVGIGGSGGNAISRMKMAKIEGVELLAINTDYQDLEKVKADFKLRIGKKITQGLGTGMRPDIGEMAARENLEEIKDVLKGADMVFITYGAGGGTGTGAGPVIAQLSKEMGILTVAIVTLPFSFEGQTRMKIAKEGILKLKENVDTLLVIKNDKLLELMDPKTPISSAFWFCDEILREGVIGISNLINSQGTINVSFGDIKSVLKNSGNAVLATAKALGPKRAEIASNLALKSPLLDLDPRGAKSILFNVSGEDVSLGEIEEIGKILTKEINPQAKVIFGTVKDKSLKKGEIKLTLIVGGLPQKIEEIINSSLTKKVENK